VTEMVAVAISLGFGYGLARCIAQFEDGANDLLTMQFHGRLFPFADGQGEIYRELRRARRFKRPMSLVALRVAKESRSAALHQHLQELRERAVQRYVDGQVAQLLTDYYDESGTVVHYHDHFIIALPELNHSDAESAIMQLNELAEAKLGLRLRAGIASFPDEELTFNGLLERATAELDGSRDKRSTNNRAVPR
jgi:hypothetical protein